jgi:hypothetical protein
MAGRRPSGHQARGARRMTDTRDMTMIQAINDALDVMMRATTP